MTPQPPANASRGGSLRRELLALLVVYGFIALPALLFGWLFGP